jgi:bifunctional ADP-heptose synthase (sugar kinase/adenylyltransferase)
VDTRTKIVSAGEAARIAASGAMVVSGYFDPLLAIHAERLEELKREQPRPLIVAIADPDNPILPARARAELVAGLAVVDYVTESAEGLTSGLVPIFRLEQEHQAALDDLIERVHARQLLTQAPNGPGAP